MAANLQDLANLRNAIRGLTTEEPENNDQNAIPGEPVLNVNQVQANDEMQVVLPNENIDHYLIPFLNRPIKPIGDKYSGVKKVISRTKSKDDWIDTEPGKRPCYNLLKMDADELVELGNNVFKSIQGELNAKYVCSLLLLAYNLRDSGGNDCFGDIDPDLIGTEMDFSDIPDQTLGNTGSMSQFRITITEGTTEKDKQEYENLVANSFCYLAASYLRLYTKSTANYMKINEHLSNRFVNFFNHEMVIENFQPSAAALTQIKSQIDVNGVLRNTFYNLIYAGESSEFGKPLKEFLYVIHTQFTGMHCYLLFIKCINALKTDNATLMNVMTCGYFGNELDALSILFNNFHGTEEVESMKRQMWKYARLFDQNFMIPLQTKNCVMFTATLAYLYHSIVPPERNQDARKIARIVAMTKEQKTKARMIAARVIFIIQGKQFDGNFEGINLANIPAPRG